MSYMKNKECSLYLGVHVAEQVLSRVFKDVEVMPFGNRGYDFICNKEKKIDVKSSCIHKDGYWGFNLSRNTLADYFLCLAFDSREDLTPLHAWLLPGEKFRLTGVKVHPEAVEKWDMFEVDITKIASCCEHVLKDHTEIRRYEGDDDDVGSPATIERKQRKTRLVEHIRQNSHEMKEPKMIALFCIREGISKATVDMYLEELLDAGRLKRIGDTLRAV